jgi:hypothetical protein
MLAVVRNPSRWLIFGFVMITVGIIPIFMTGGRIALVLAGAVVALVAIGRIHARPHIDDYDKRSPNTASRYHEPPYGGSWGP